MPYIKQTWIDNESPLTADRMNHIEDGIESTDASVTSLDSRINNLAGGGQPIVVTSADQMEDNTKIYLYVGNETGYETGHWYYYTTEWVDGGQYGADGGINGNARNLLKYILERVAYTETGMQVYVDALYQALAQTGGGGDEPTTYMIMNVLTYVTNSNAATGADEGDSYTATLTPYTDYTISSVTVTMGGVDVTSTVYSNGVITISSVTGDVVITATATYGAILYQLPAPMTFDGTQTSSFNTEVQPLVTDQDFTVTCRINRSGVYVSDSYIWQCMEGVSPYWGFKLQEYGNKFQFVIFGQDQIVADFLPTNTGLLKIVIRHTAGTSTCNVQICAANNTVITYTVGTSVKGINAYLRLGGNGFNGTVDKLVWYERLLTDAEATAFLEDNS